MHIADAVEQMAIGADADDEVASRSVLDAIGVAVYTTDARGSITYFNEAAVQLWGRRPDLGEQWCGSLRLYGPDGTPMPHSECPMAITLREQRPIRGATAILERPDGSRVWFMPCPSPIFRDGTMIGAVNVLVDVTRQRQAEERLRETAGALQVSNAVKDDFLGLVSHELRTPVTTVFGNARLLDSRYDSLSDTDRRSMVTDIAQEAGRLRGTIENLLAMTRAGSGVELSIEPHLLGRLVRRTVESYRARHPGRDLRLEVPQPDAMVWTDESAVELVMENLLSNAHKYSPPDKAIDVIVRGPAGDGELASVAVLDRGIGIESGETEQLFEPFYRGARARAYGGGLGIGLAVAKRLAESQGGSIQAAARAGGGTEVWLCVPLWSA